MKKMTICEASLKALKLVGKPLNINEIYDLIIENNFYQFKSKSPLSVLKAEIRKHTEGIKLKVKDLFNHFKLMDNGKFWINLNK